MPIRVVEDLVVPGAVVAADLASEKWFPTWNEWLAYIAAGGGYVASAMGYGGDMTKNAGIASLDWAARKLRDRFSTMGVTGRSVAAYRSVSRPAGSVAAAVKPEFRGIVNY